MTGACDLYLDDSSSYDRSEESNTLLNNRIQFSIDPISASCSLLSNSPGFYYQASQSIDHVRHFYLIIVWHWHWLWQLHQHQNGKSISFGWSMPGCKISQQQSRQGTNIRISNIARVRLEYDHHHYQQQWASLMVVATSQYQLVVCDRHHHHQRVMLSAENSKYACVIAI